MKKLRTIYPNSLNKGARKHDSEVPVGKLFYIIPRTKERSTRYRDNNDYLKKKHYDSPFYKHSYHHSKLH